MKVLFLLFTILFSASVLADCCSLEVESSGVQCQTMEAEHQDDGCSESDQHSEAQHCHCSPVNHVKIIALNKVLLTPPTSFEVDLLSFYQSLLMSQYETLIFHPPIA